MAGDKNQPKSSSGSERSSSIWPEDDNPFIAFRRFADKQISSMLQSVTGLPSMTTPPTGALEDGSIYKGTRFRSAGDDDQGSHPSGSGNDSNNDSSWPGRYPGNTNSSRNDDKNRWDPLSSWWLWSESEDPWQSHPRRWFHRTSDFFGFDSFFDRFWLDDRFSVPFGRFDISHPFFTDLMGDYESSVAWPMTYLMFSPYSPLHLEHRSRHGRGVFSSIMSSLKLKSGREPGEPQWREAFEDLLRLENGKPMLDQDSTAVSKRETGREWIEGLVERGSLGSDWKFVSGKDGQPWSGFTMDSSNFTENNRPQLEAGDADRKEQSSQKNKPITEADLYEHFLDHIENKFFSELTPLRRAILEEKHRNQEKRAENQPSSNEVIRDGASDSWVEQFRGKNENPARESTQISNFEETRLTESTGLPNVVSTMSSTERIRLPDGSMRTKIVKIKRFADGREETNESVEVTNPPQPGAGSVSNRDEAEKKDGPKGGWFWKN